MDFIAELFVEIIIEPIIEIYFFAMTHFSKDNKKIDKNKVKCIVVFECIVLMLMFIIGGVMLFESNGDSLVGKILFISSIAVSISQIIIGFLLNKLKKKSK